MRRVIVIALRFLTRWLGAVLLGQSERYHALVDRGAIILIFHS